MEAGCMERTDPVVEVRAGYAGMVLGMGLVVARHCMGVDTVAAVGEATRECRLMVNSRSARVEHAVGEEGMNEVVVRLLDW